MEQKVSQGVKISVETLFDDRRMGGNLSFKLFAYTITIENLKDVPVMLLRRKWFISDSLDNSRIVEGYGVIGKQPLLKPFESFTYSSAVDIKGDIGLMSGYYIFKNISSGDEFIVQIPRFKLEVPFVLN
jgi:ApaG protein